MTCTIVGKRRVDMNEEDVHGWSLFITRDEDGVEGQLAERVFIRDGMIGADLSGLVPDVGNELEFEYNSKGKIAKLLAVG